MLCSVSLLNYLKTSVLFVYIDITGSIKNSTNH